MSELALQKALRSTETPASLKESLGIMNYTHPTEALIGFKYHQLDSPKTNPIVREARGIVLERDTWKVVAKPFNRFFNAGEDFEEFKKFNWSNFSCIEKADGSLIICYFYNGSWRINTSGSFGFGEVSFTDIKWHDLFWETAKLDIQKLDPSNTYLFELCTVYNKVVRTYLTPVVYLLGCVVTSTFKEFSEADCDAIAQQLGIARPERFEFQSLQQIEKFLDDRTEKDPTFEGVIIRDDSNMRYKVKSKTYLSLHHMKDNGNLFNPKNLVPWALKEDPDELLAYFPETKEALDKVKNIIEAEWQNLKQVWEKSAGIPDQKQFALAIKDRSKFVGLLFTCRKKKGSLSDLRDLWRTSEDSIIKFLF